MAKTVASRKGKARKLQQTIRDKIIENYPDLTLHDVVSVPMGVTGSDIMLSSIGREQFPYSVEAKNVEKLNIWKALKQTESENDNRDLTPVLVFKRNFSNAYAVIDLDYFIELTKYRFNYLNNICDDNNKIIYHKIDTDVDMIDNSYWLEYDQITK